MQIKNIILSLAAVVALVQAVPMPADGAAPATEAKPADAKPAQNTELYDLCISEYTKNPSTEAGAVVTNAQAKVICAQCFQEAITKCGPDTGKSTTGEQNQDAAKVCYSKAMAECKAKKSQPLGTSPDKVASGPVGAVAPGSPQ